MKSLPNNNLYYCAVASIQKSKMELVENPYGKWEDERKRKEKRKNEKESKGQRQLKRIEYIKPNAWLLHFCLCTLNAFSI